MTGKKKQSLTLSQQTSMSGCNARRAPRLITAVCWKQENSKVVKIPPITTENARSGGESNCRPFRRRERVHPHARRLRVQPVCGSSSTNVRAARHARGDTGGADVPGGWRVAGSVSSRVFWTPLYASDISLSVFLGFFNRLGEEVGGK